MELTTSHIGRSQTQITQRLRQPQRQTQTLSYLFNLIGVQHPTNCNFLTFKIKIMKPSTWIKKNSDCPILTAKAINLLDKTIIQFQLSSDSIRQSYIRQMKDSLKNSDLYADYYVLAAKAFLKYYSL